MNSYIDIRENKNRQSDSYKRGVAAIREGFARSACILYNFFAMIISFLSEGIVSLCIRGGASCLALYFIIGNAGAFEAGEISFISAFIRSILAILAFVGIFKLFKED